MPTSYVLRYFPNTKRFVSFSAAAIGSKLHFSITAAVTSLSGIIMSLTWPGMKRSSLGLYLIWIPIC